MFTICPKCERQFRIYAEHIAAAGGQVRCGFCDEQFNALERLHDEPVKNEVLVKDKVAEPVEPTPQEESTMEFEIEMEAEPQFDITPEEEAASEEVVINDDQASQTQELETAIDEIGVKSTTVELDTVPEIDLTPAYETVPVNEAIQEQEPEPQSELDAESESSSAHFEFDDPEAMFEPEPPRKSRLMTAFWSVACLVGFIALVLQLAWFNRDRVLVEYPELLPYVKQLCSKYDCPLLRQKDTSAIKLVNRDVRLHPRFKETLLVNATMENEMDIPQPYPRVQLTLFDTSGALLGHRDFSPDDYLDNSIDIDAGMPVKLPVHFVLEVSGPTAGAVSFEFRFL